MNQIRKFPFEKIKLSWFGFTISNRMLFLSSKWFYTWVTFECCRKLFSFHVHLNFIKSNLGWNFYSRESFFLWKIIHAINFVQKVYFRVLLITKATTNSCWDAGSFVVKESCERLVIWDHLNWLKILKNDINIESELYLKTWIELTWGLHLISNIDWKLHSSAFFFWTEKF